MENKPATTTLSRTATAITFRSGFLCRTSTLYCQDSLSYQKGLHVVNGKQTSNNNTIKDRYCYCCHHIQVCLFLPEQHLILPGLSKLSKKICWCSQWKTNQKQQHYQGPLLPSPSGLAFCAGPAPHCQDSLSYIKKDFM